MSQLSYDIGPVTLSGGYRREDGELEVDDYTTTAFRNRVFVEGGKLDYKADLTNVGAIWRITDEWSVFAAYSKGFTLPNVGIPLRNISIPGHNRSPGSCDLQPDHRVDNNEVGFNWRGAQRLRSTVRSTDRSPNSACRCRSIRPPTISS